MKPFDQQTDEELLQSLQRALHELQDAPAALQRAALDLWPAAVPAPSPLVAAVAAVASLRRLVAALAFDSWAQPAAALGMRSGGGDTRHLLYSVEGRDVDLRISPAGALFALAGQVLGPEETGVIELAREDAGREPSRLAALDATGEFHLDGVGTGSYVLTLRVGDDEIVLPALRIGGRQH